MMKRLKKITNSRFLSTVGLSVILGQIFKISSYDRYVSISGHGKREHQIVSKMAISAEI